LLFFHLLLIISFAHVSCLWIFIDALVQVKQEELPKVRWTPPPTPPPRSKSFVFSTFVGLLLIDIYYLIN
jgi:hypothetical protein